MNLDVNLFKDIVAKFPTGITIVTTSYNGKNFGFTANSFTSVSISPLLVSFCIAKSSGSLEAFLYSESFCINFLAENQVDLSKIFACKIRNKFESAKFSLIDNLPVLDDVLGYMILKQHSVHEAGDHFIIVGEMLKGYKSDEAQALCYYNRKYSTINI